MHKAPSRQSYCFPRTKPSSVARRTFIPVSHDPATEASTVTGPTLPSAGAFSTLPPVGARRAGPSIEFGRSSSARGVVLSPCWRVLTTREYAQHAPVGVEQSTQPLQLLVYRFWHAAPAHPHGLLPELAHEPPHSLRVEMFGGEQRLELAECLRDGCQIRVSCSLEPAPPAPHLLDRPVHRGPVDAAPKSVEGGVQMFGGNMGLRHRSFCPPLDPLL